MLDPVSRPRERGPWTSCHDHHHRWWPRGCPEPATNTTGTALTPNKRFVNAQIDLSPLTATNSITENHVITATVQQNDGLAAGHRRWRRGLRLRTGPGRYHGHVQLLAERDRCDVRRREHLPDGAAGTCTITITSSTAGTVRSTRRRPSTSARRHSKRSRGQRTASASTAATPPRPSSPDPYLDQEQQRECPTCRCDVRSLSDAHLNTVTGLQDDTADVCASIVDDSVAPVGASTGLTGPGRSPRRRRIPADGPRPRPVHRPGDGRPGRLRGGHPDAADRG